MNGTRVWAAAAALLLAATARGESWKFDMGPESSPVMKGSKQVTDKTVFAEGKKFGWLAPCEGTFDREDAKYPQFGTEYTRAEVAEPANDMLIDGVESTQDMTFRVDLPNGKYWVMAYAGDLGKKTFKTALSANGKLIDNKTDAFTYRNRGSVSDPTWLAARTASAFPSK